MPLADAARRLDVSCGKRPAALPHAHGASPRLSGQTLVRRSDACRELKRRRNGRESVELCPIEEHGGTCCASGDRELTRLCPALWQRVHCVRDEAS